MEIIIRNLKIGIVKSDYFWSNDLGLGFIEMGDFFSILVLFNYLEYVYDYID